MAKWTRRAMSVAGLLGTAILTPVVAAQSTVFINEIHYDNVSTDVDEALEIAGPAGTDLSGWTVALYNGNGGGTYNTLALTVLADNGTGIGTEVLAFPSNGIQNGAPDGLALVDNDGTVVQFLSYEGSFTATNGPAAGMTSTDIGVAESSSTPAGFSLQLVGSGTEAADFSWAPEMLATFGSLNTGQTYIPGDDGGGNGGGGGGGDADQVFLSEFHYDNEGTDVGEFVEVVGDAGSDLSAWTVVLYNGSNGSAYNTLALDGNPDSNPLEACGDSNQGLVVLDLPSNGIQNGAPDGIALVNSIGEVVEFISYEGSFTANDGPAAGMTSVDIGASQNSSSPVGSSLEFNGSSWSFQETSGRGQLFDGTVCPGFEPPPPVELTCNAPADLIHTIQGSGGDSPLEDSEVTVEAVVVGDFQETPDGRALRGFFLQEEDIDADSDPMTSEGIFVFQGAGIPDFDVAVGDLVRVRGEVAEFFGMTQIDNVSAAISCGDGYSVTPATPQFPLAEVEDLEAFEGMSVYIPYPMTISEYFNFDRFGEMVLALPLTTADGLASDDDRPYQPTARAEPGATANDLQAANERRRITLDDGQTSSNPSILRHPNGQPFSLSNLFRGGDTVSEIRGVLNYSFSLYRIQPTEGAVHTPLNIRPTAPSSVGGEITVASYNVLNFFTTLDDGSRAGCSPNGSLECRGADANQPLEFDRQRDKLLAALGTIQADIFGLIEIENNATEAVESLVSGLNDVLGDGTYAYVNTGTIGSDAIKVAFIFKPGTVRPFGDFAILDSSVDPNYIDTKNRPALAQTFTDLSSGARFTLAVNHFKSKGSACTGSNSLIDDPDTGDGQGNCNLTRTLAAEAEVRWLAADPTGSGDPDIMIIGDLNAYTLEDPIDAIIAGADGETGTDDDYVNLIEAADEERKAYSYVFSGQFGYLDHALANLPLASQVTGITEWPINADEPDALDYDTSFKSAEVSEIYEPDAFRSSDHDPVIIGLAPLASIEDILVFFEDAVVDGTIVGTGKKPSKNVDKLRKELNKAIDDLAKGEDEDKKGKGKGKGKGKDKGKGKGKDDAQEKACKHIEDAVDRTDGASKPKDKVEGEDVEVLNAMLVNYRNTNCD